MVVSRQLLTVRQVADRLALKESTIRRRILERRIGYVKNGRAVRIPESEVEGIIVDGWRPAVTGRPKNG